MALGTLTRGDGRCSTVNASLASAITKAASKQTYYTIRFLVDRPRIEDAYRAYAYFRWIDDVLDADVPRAAASSAVEQVRRARFLDRQRSLLDRCLRGDVPRDVSRHEAMLVELIRGAGGADRGLEAYLRHMMLVMHFDVGRRGRLITEAELAQYTRWLATAVTEAMHYFIGGGAPAPHDTARYMAATGAHIVHMLRDTCADMRTGYFNVPKEVLEAGSISPEDIRSDPYRAWVKARVRLARACFDTGRAYLARVQSARHRLAALAYISRFEWLTEALEEEDFVVRADYAGRRGIARGLRMARDVALWMSGLRRPDAPSAATRSSPVGRI